MHKPEQAKSADVTRKSKKQRRQVAAEVAVTPPDAPRSGSEGKGLSKAKGAPRHNVNALRHGRHSKKTTAALARAMDEKDGRKRSKGAEWAREKNRQKTARERIWEAHCRKVTRQALELRRSLGVEDDPGCKLTTAEMVRTLLIVHRKDAENLHTRRIKREDLMVQLQASRDVVAAHHRLLDRAAALAKPKPSG